MKEKGRKKEWTKLRKESELRTERMKKQKKKERKNKNMKDKQKIR